MKAGYMFVGPYLFGLLAFTVIPFIYSLYLAFSDYNGFTTPKFIGLGNFIEMFTKDKTIWLSLKVTFKYAVISVPLYLAVSLGAAMLICKKTKITTAYRMIFYLPCLLSGSVAMMVTWKRVFSPEGLVNQLLNFLGLESVKWLHDPRITLYVLIFMGIWSFGNSMLIFLAGLKNIPNTLLEAAIVDGASPLKVFLKIKLPILSPVIFYNLVMGMIGSLQAFSDAYLVTAGGPLRSTLYYGLYQYQMGFERGHMGYASAMAWFLMLIILALTALVFKSSAGWVYFQDDG